LWGTQNRTRNSYKREERTAIMIKVIVGYKVEPGENIAPIVLKLRTHAMTYNGFVSSEHLMNDDENSIIAILETWNSIEEWREWEKSPIRQALLRDAQPLLAEEPRVTRYKIIPTVWNP